MDSTTTSDAQVGGVVLLCLSVVVIFFVPSIIAFLRRHPNRYAILVVNFVFGGTGFGWLGCLIWAFNAVHLPTDRQRSRGGESGLNLFVNDPRLVHVVSTSEVVTTPPSRPRMRLSATAAIAELDRLSRLHSAGHLSDAELAVLKQDILMQMR